MTEQAIQMRQEQVQIPDAEAVKRDEAERLSLNILRREGRKIYQKHKETNDAPQTAAERAMELFAMLEDREAIKELPADGSGEETPQPINLKSTDAAHALKIRVKREGGAFTILQNQGSADGENVHIVSINGRRGDMIVCVGERQLADGRKSEVFMIPASEIALAQLSAEADSLQNAPQLSQGERNIVKAQHEIRMRGPDGITPDTSRVINEAARSAGMLTRGSMESYLQAARSNVDLNNLLPADATLMNAEQVMRVFEAGGMFNKNTINQLADQAKAMAESAGQRAGDIQKRVTELQGLLSKQEGETVNVGGQDVQVTAAMLTQWQTEALAATDELQQARAEEAEARKDEQQLRTQAEQVQDMAQFQTLMQEYLGELDDGLISAGEAQKFMSAVENNDQRGLFEALLERQLEKNKVPDKDKVKAEAMKKFDKYSKGIMLAGGFAIILLGILFKDALGK